MRQQSIDGLSAQEGNAIFFKYNINQIITKLGELTVLELYYVRGLRVADLVEIITGVPLLRELKYGFSGTR